VKLGLSFAVKKFNLQPSTTRFWMISGFDTAAMSLDNLLHNRES
jgi:hypothetical protein